MSKLNLVNPQITFYIRTAKKIGFIAKSEKNILTDKQLKIIAQSKSKIPAENQILYYNGQQVLESSQIQVVDKSIVHVLDSRNVGKSKIKLLVKRLFQNSHVDSFEVDSDVSIQKFIQDKLSGYYQEPADKLFFVYSGRQLRRQKSFTQQHVESQSQVFCLHQDKDQKRKTHTASSSSSVKSFKTIDTVPIKQNEPKLMQTLEQKPEKQMLTFKKTQIYRQQTKQDTVTLFSAREYKDEQIKSQNKYISRQDSSADQKDCVEYINDKNGQNIIQDVQQTDKKERKLIKSIGQIKCEQIQSDEDSDPQDTESKKYLIPRKLAEDFLMEQTRQRSNTRQSNHNNSQSSAISEPNFKKKKKVSQIELTSKSAEGQDKNQLEQQKISENDVRQSQKINVFKKKQEIFDQNSHTCSSVIEDSLELQSASNLKNLQEKVSLQQMFQQRMNSTQVERQDTFNPSQNRHEQELYDSQMNAQYYRLQSSKIQLKENRGFMNFSNASFLQNQKTQNNQISQEQSSPKSRYQNIQSHFKGLQNVEAISNRAPQFLNDSFGQPNQQENHKMSQILQKQGDSLSFSKYQSDSHQNEQSQDNLFTQYKRGILQTDRNRQILIQQEDISQSNLLSDTCHIPNMNEHMNSITFNLEPNPDEHSSQFKPNSYIQIVNQSQISKDNEVQFEGKTQSGLETNFKDSAEPSQIYSNPSQINVAHYGINENDEDIPIEPLSLIENLIEMIDYKVNVNQVESQNSDNQDHEGIRHFQTQGSEISYRSEQKQPKQQTIEYDKTLKQAIEQESSLNVFVSYQSCRVDNYIISEEFQKGNYNKNNQNQGDLLYENVYERNPFPSERSNFEGSNLQRSNFQNDIAADDYQQAAHKIGHIQALQNSIVKIQDQEQISSYQNQYRTTNHQPCINEYLTGNQNNQSVECSAAFHQISQSYNGNQAEENIVEGYQHYEIKKNRVGETTNCQINNPEPEITFGKAQRQDEGRIQYIRGSNLLVQIQSQAQSVMEENQLLPGDYIYSTDRIQDPDQVLDTILSGFRHCF